MGTPAAPQARTANLRWWLAFAFLAVGVALLGWVSVSTWRDRRRQDTAEEPALEYFPDCYLVDLHGVTDRPTHRLSGKYNMITRLQNPPEIVHRLIVAGHGPQIALGDDAVHVVVLTGAGRGGRRRWERGFGTNPSSKPG